MGDGNARGKSPDKRWMQNMCSTPTESWVSSVSRVGRLHVQSGEWGGKAVTTRSFESWHPRLSLARDLYYTRVGNTEAAATRPSRSHLDRRIRIRITRRLKRTYENPLNTSPPTTRDGCSIVFGRCEDAGGRHRGQSSRYGHRAGREGRQGRPTDRQTDEKVKPTGTK